MNYLAEPEFISHLEYVNGAGDCDTVGERIASMTVSKSKNDADAEVQLDFRDVKRGTNLLVRIPLARFVAALSQATLHADHNP